MCRILDRVAANQPLTRLETQKYRKHLLRTSPVFLEKLKNTITCAPKSKSGLIYRKTKEQAGYLSSTAHGISYKVYLNRTYFTSSQLILLLNNQLPASPSHIAMRRDINNMKLIFENLYWKLIESKLPAGVDMHYRHTRVEKNGHFTAMYRNGLKLVKFGYFDDAYLAHLHAVEQAYLLDFVNCEVPCTLQLGNTNPVFTYIAKPHINEILENIHNLRFAHLSA